MIPCIKLPVAFPEDGVPTASNIKDIISAFFPQEWPSVDPATIKLTHKASFANAHCIVERPATQSSVSAYSEPIKLFVKIHKGAEGSVLHAFDNLVPTKQEEATLCYQYGKSGLGAQMFGFFELSDGTQGRIDQFLEARNMEPEDVEDEALRGKIASAFASFHAMKAIDYMPQRPVETFYHAIFDGLGKYHKSEKLKHLARKGGVELDDLVEYDFISRLRKAITALEEMGAKKGWNIHDVQYMNVMITHSVPHRPILIDFEFVMHNYRAFDIGGHFMQKLFKWFDQESTIAKCRPFTMEEKRHFCDNYARRWNEITGDEDSGERVLQEAELGYLLAISFDVHNMLCYMDETGDKDPLNLTGLRKLFEEFTMQVEKLGID